MTTPADVLAAARALLKRADRETAGLWPRAAALLARQALEAALDDFWRQKGLALHDAPTRPQLICLRSYVDEAVAGRLHHAWAALSRACHHHPYELAPAADELAAWMEAAGSLTSSTDPGRPR